MKGRKVAGQDFNMSIGGGGRYDKIITTFADKENEYPAVGMSFGLDVIYEILLIKEGGKRMPTVDVYVIHFGTYQESFKFASKLRDVGLNVEIDSEKLKIKDMMSGESVEFDINDIKAIQEFVKAE